MDNTSAQPRRRFQFNRRFQFRLSTWFVLIAIAAWALATRPYMVEVWRKGTARATWNGHWGEPMDLRAETLNPGLLYPALALAGFVVWKSRRVLVARRGAMPAIEP